MTPPNLEQVHRNNRRKLYLWKQTYAAQELRSAMGQAHAAERDPLRRDGKQRACAALWLAKSKSTHRN